MKRFANVLAESIESNIKRLIDPKAYYAIVSFPLSHVSVKQRPFTFNITYL